MNKTLRLLAAITAAGVCTSASACLLSPSEALNRLVSTKKIKGISYANPVLLKTVEKDSSPTIYLFSTNGGNIVVSAESETTPLLGYTNEKYGIEDLPPAFCAWLETLSSEIAECSASVNRVRAEGDDFAPISPLCRTKWYQLAPYNDLCPMDRSTGERSVTGCVATAMAQVMKYHEWPAEGEGKIEYEWERSKTHLSLDFSKQSYDWANMLDEYNKGGYNDIEGKAVANLMKSCGYSVEMNYSSEASGAYSMYIAYALGEFFKYNKSEIRFIKREYYTLGQWEKNIYESLSNYGPVILNGVSNIGGHSFVCDGYESDGFFHINWGWGGISDGYYLLSALDPDVQGTGGSGDNSGFNYMQDAIVGITPARDIENGESSWIGAMLALGDFGVDISEVYRAGEDEYIDNLCPDGVFNYGPTVIPGDMEIGLLFRSNNNGKCYIEPVAIEEELGIAYGFKDFDLPLPEYLPDGGYRMTMSYRSASYSGPLSKSYGLRPDSSNESPEESRSDDLNGGWIDVLFPEDYAMAYNAYVDNGKITFEESSWRPSGLKEVMSEEETKESRRYYNLQGIELSAPQPGQIVIVRTGGTVRKVIF